MFVLQMWSYVAVFTYHHELIVSLNGLKVKKLEGEISWSRHQDRHIEHLLNQYSPAPRACSLIAGKDATLVGARVARAQIYAGLGIRIDGSLDRFVKRSLPVHIWHQLTSPDHVGSVIP